MNRHAVLTKPGNIQLEHYKPDFISPGDCVVEVCNTVVCNLDARAFQGYKTRLKLNNPIVLGHEISGRVLQPGNSGIAEGKLVSIIGSSFCNDCAFCRHGLPLQCANFQISCGGFSDQIVIPQAWTKWRLVPIPSDTNTVSAAYLDSIACIITAINQALIQKHQRLLILGSGFMAFLFRAIAQLKELDVTTVGSTSYTDTLCALANQVRFSDEKILHDVKMPFDVIVDFGIITKQPFALNKLLRPAGKYLSLSRRSSVLLDDLGQIYENQYHLLHSFHSDLHNRLEAVQYLNPLSEMINTISQSHSIENIQDALVRVANRTSARCHIDFTTSGVIK